MCVYHILFSYLAIQVCDTHIFLMHDQTNRIANLLGAAVLGLQDKLQQTVEQRTGRTGEAPAALCVLGHQPGLSNNALSRLLNLTHTGTVRLIDGLVRDGLVERRQSKTDKRVISLHHTTAGETLRRQILKDREKVFASLVSQLSAKEQSSLTNLLEKLLVTVSTDNTHKLRICRLCDGDACTECPIHVPIIRDHKSHSDHAK